MTQQSGPRSPRQDDQLAHETQGLEKAGHSTRAEEWRDPEPSAEDQPTTNPIPDGRGTPAGMDEQDIAARTELAQFLGRSAFPGRAEELLSVAQQNQATDVVLAQLRRLPAGETFENVQQVVQRLGFGTEQERS